MPVCKIYKRKKTRTRRKKTETIFPRKKNYRKNMSSIFDLSERLLSPPSSPVTGSSDSDGHPMNEQRALEKLALELSMFDCTEPVITPNSSDMAVAAALMNLDRMQHSMQHSPNDGLVAGSTLNAFTSMLGYSPAGGHFDDRSKKSQNMTECVPVPSSEHVAEIVGRQGELRPTSK